MRGSAGGDHTSRRVLLVIQSVSGISSGKGVLDLEIRETDRSEDGTRIPPAPVKISLRVNVERDGTVLMAGGTGPQSDLDRLISSAFPRLPAGPAAIGDDWDAGLSVSSETARAVLKGSGTLAGFSLEGRRRLAHIDLRRSGDIGASQTIGRARLDLSGRTEIETSAEIDVDHGILVKSRSVSTTHLKAPEGARPAPASRSIEVVTEVELLSG